MELIVVSFLLIPSIIAVGFTEVDFCKLKCGEIENNACNCKKLQNRVDDVTNIIQFRAHILDKHNKLRNKIASGEEKHKFAGQASDMNVLNYDLELEYQARCSGSKYVVDHPKCCRTSKFANPGQNVAWSAKKPKRIHETLNLIDSFYDAIEFIENTTIDSYKGEKGLNDKRIDRFTQLIWSTHTHVGCGRTHNPNPALSRDRFLLICNYGGANLSNAVGQPVYKKGQPCGACPKDVKCNGIYPALCGKVESTPMDHPATISGGISAICRNRAILFLGLRLIFVVITIV